MGVVRSALAALLLATGSSAAMAHVEENSPFGYDPAAARYYDQFVSVQAPLVALTGVRVIDGTGAAPRENQIVLLRDGKIEAVGAKLRIPAGAKVVSLNGKTLVPGWVMHHEHLYQHSLTQVAGMPYLAQPSMVTYPRLYLASGVTTARSIGTYHPHDDLKLQEGIARGVFLGPDFEMTAPFVQGKASYFQLMPEVANPQEATDWVRFWGSRGFDSFKTYIHVTRDEMRAAATEAHRQGKRISAHLCSVPYGEAVDLGIDEIEHGFQGIMLDMVPPSESTECRFDVVMGQTPMLDVASPKVRALFDKIIAKGVVIDSTLGGMARLMNNALLPALEDDDLRFFTAERRAQWPAEFARRGRGPDTTAFLSKLMELDHAFWKAGGKLVVGADAVTLYGALPGRTNLDSLTLLAKAGIPPLEVIKIATSNGAAALGKSDRGTIAPGKRADLIVIDGDPSKDFRSIYRIETVFKAGVGYDAAKLKHSVEGTIGLIN